jgi:(p)ppGpp synthase/HD superfamily hydrolase
MTSMLKESTAMLLAYKAAALAHADQRRHDGEPYINHCIRVATLVSQSPWATYDMVSAAVLHDIVEDTIWTIDEVYAIFGNSVGFLVKALTDTKDPALNRAERHAVYLKQLVVSTPAVQTIKMADICDNTTDLATLKTPEFRLQYAHEQLTRINGLDRADPQLTARATRQIADFLLTQANHSRDFSDPASGD